MVWRAPNVDQVEGSLVDDERSMLPGYLAYQRSVVLRRCAGLTGEELARRTVPPSSLSLLGLLRHLAKVERRWFRERFAGEQLDPLYDPARGADADFDDLGHKLHYLDTATGRQSEETLKSSLSHASA